MASSEQTAAGEAPPPSLKRLQGKVAVVVGAGQAPGETIGNGRAAAIRYACEGALTFLVDRSLERAEATLSAVREAGGEGHAFAADIGDEAQCNALVAEAVRVFGRLDVLHNNVGIAAGDGDGEGITARGWDLVFSVNVRGVAMTCRQAIPIMRAQGGGSIVNISSLAAIGGFPWVAYKSSKAALNAYTQSIAYRYAPDRIRANVIMPGLIDTPHAIDVLVRAGGDRDEIRRRRDSMVPLGGRMGTGWDVANAAVFLASDEARFITGSCLLVDGGQSLGIG